MNIADFQAVFQHWGGADVLPNVGDTAITRALKRKNLLQALEVKRLRLAQGEAVAAPATTAASADGHRQLHRPPNDEAAPPNEQQPAGSPLHQEAEPLAPPLQPLPQRQPPDTKTGEHCQPAGSPANGQASRELPQGHSMHPAAPPAILLPAKRPRELEDVLAEDCASEGYHTPPSQRMPAPGVTAPKTLLPGILAAAGGSALSGHAAQQSRSSTGGSTAAAALTAQGLHVSGAGAEKDVLRQLLRGAGSLKREAVSGDKPAVKPPAEGAGEKKQGKRRQQTRIGQALRARQPGSRLQFSSTAVASSQQLPTRAKAASLSGGRWGSMLQGGDRAAPHPSLPQSPPFKLSLPCVGGSPQADPSPPPLPPPPLAAAPLAVHAVSQPAMGTQQDVRLPGLANLPPTPTGLFDFTESEAGAGPHNPLPISGTALLQDASGRLEDQLFKLSETQHPFRLGPTHRPGRPPLPLHKLPRPGANPPLQQHHQQQQQQAQVDLPSAAGISKLTAGPTVSAAAVVCTMPAALPLPPPPPLLAAAKPALAIPAACGTATAATAGRPRSFQIKLPQPALLASPSPDGRHLALLLGSHAADRSPTEVVLLQLALPPPGRTANPIPSPFVVVASMPVQRSPHAHDVAVGPSWVQVASDVHGEPVLLLSAALELPDCPPPSRPAVHVVPCGAGTRRGGWAGRAVAVETDSAMLAVAHGSRPGALLLGGDTAAVVPVQFDGLWGSYTLGKPLPKAFFKSYDMLDACRLLPVRGGEGSIAHLPGPSQRELLLGLSSDGMAMLWDAACGRFLGAKANVGCIVHDLLPVSLPQAGLTTPERARMVAAAAAASETQVSSQEDGCVLGGDAPDLCFLGRVQCRATGTPSLATVVVTASSAMAVSEARAFAGHVTAHAVAGQHAFVGTACGRLLVWDLAEGGVVGEGADVGGGQAITCVAVMPASALAASAASPGVGSALNVACAEGKMRLVVTSAGGDCAVLDVAELLAAQGSGPEARGQRDSQGSA